MQICRAPYWPEEREVPVCVGNDLNEQLHNFHYSLKIMDKIKSKGIKRWGITGNMHGRNDQILGRKI
jgi:hypothetical protein